MIIATTGCDLSLFSSLSPPWWIRETWDLKQDGFIVSTFKFTHDNIIWTIGSLVIDFKEVGEQEDVTVSDKVISSTEYEVMVKDKYSTETFTFSKFDYHTLDVSINSGGVTQTIYDFKKR
jgi:hypothetical protein